MSIVYDDISPSVDGDFFIWYTFHHRDFPKRKRYGMVKDKIVFGGLYRPKSRTAYKDGDKPYNDQMYMLCLPIAREDGSVWMLDTYQIRRLSTKDGESLLDAIVNTFTSDYKGYELSHAMGLYYYRNYRKIETEEDLSLFELVCDLRAMEELPYGDDPRMYNENDLIRGVKLYNEHGFSWTLGSVGITLKRRDATKDARKVLMFEMERFLDRLKVPSGQSELKFLLEKIKPIRSEAEDSLSPEDREWIGAVFELNHTLVKMRDEIEGLVKKVYRY